MVVLLVVLIITMINFFVMMQMGVFFNNISSRGRVVAIVGVVEDSIEGGANITRLRQVHPEEDGASLASGVPGRCGCPSWPPPSPLWPCFSPSCWCRASPASSSGELILVVAGVFLVSLALAVTLTPMLTSIIVGRERPATGKAISSGGFASMTAGYTWVLELSLRYRKLVFGGFILILLGAVALFPWLGSEFLPRMDDGRVMVKVKLPTGAALTETSKILSRVEEKLQGDPSGRKLRHHGGGQGLGPGHL